MPRIAHEYVRRGFGRRRLCWVRVPRSSIADSLYPTLPLSTPPILPYYTFPYHILPYPTTP